MVTKHAAFLINILQPYMFAWNLEMALQIGAVIHTYNASTWEAVAGRLLKFKAS